MDCNPMKEKDAIIDIPSCIVTTKDVESPSLNSDDTIIGNTVSFTISGMPMGVDEIIKGGDSSIISSSPKNGDEVSPELSSDKNNNNNSKREKRKPMSAKKPPRPPRGISLNASDQNLIKELAELAMIKRARFERIKALKKLKAAKASSSSSPSSSSSSTGNLVAMLFTIIFFIVIVFQGCHSSGVSKHRLAVPITGSQGMNGVVEGNIVDQYNLSTVGVLLTTVESPSRLETARGSDSKD